MNRSPVLVFDSGVGGLPYLEAIRSLLPSERLEYLADSGHFPYGLKTREEVERVVRLVVGRAIAELRPKLVVVACNTASQAALAALRADHPDLPIVGTVPAIKPAAETSRTRVIGVLATAAAVKDPYLDELVERHAAGARVVRKGAQELVAFVEKRLFDATEDERRAVCAEAVAPLVAAGADRIVLACTHFLHVAADLAEAAGKGVETVDSREGVARRVEFLLREREALAGAGEVARGRLRVTGPEPDATMARFAERFGLECGPSFGDLDA
ncbi:MAG: glutamate racemase [Spirochaetia bacterium]|nr:glutamate racemase [Spirochaetia bacterium]